MPVPLLSRAKFSFLFWYLVWLCQHSNSSQAFQGIDSRVITTATAAAAAAFAGLSSRTTRRASRERLVKVTLFLSSNDNSDNNDSDNFMKALQSRMAQVQDNDTRLPIVVLDSMLPRQTLKIQVENDIFQRLISTLVQQERPRFGMIGVATLAVSGQTIPLQNGVEVELVGQPIVVDADTNNNSDTNNASPKKALRVTLKAGRRFRIHQNQLETNPSGWTEARVVFLSNDSLDNDEEDEDDDDHDDEEEANDNLDASISEHEPEDPVSLAIAVELAQQLTNKNLNLVDLWIALARKNQQFDGQIDTLLQDLGEIPPATRPTDRAFWVGALINPLPGMGVAMEIRPSLLMAKTAQERVGIVLGAIQASIHHMDGTKQLF